METAIIDRLHRFVSDGGRPVRETLASETLVQPVEPMSRYEIIWKTVKRVPFGRVATYEQIAVKPGWKIMPDSLVCFACTAKGIQIPWHRIINSAGRISTSPSARRQKKSEQKH